MGCCRRNFDSSSLRPRKRIQTRSSVQLIEVRSRRDLAVRSEHICERSVDSASTPTQAVKEFASAPPALRATSPSMGRTNFSPSGAARHLPINGEDQLQPLRRCAPPPHQWGGPTSAPPALRATSPSMGRTNFSPSRAARHLPMNGRTGHLGGGGRLQLAAGRFHLLQRLHARPFFHRRAQVDQDPDLERVLSRVQPAAPAPPVGAPPPPDDVADAVLLPHLP